MKFTFDNAQVNDRRGGRCTFSDECCATGALLGSAEVGAQALALPVAGLKMGRLNLNDLADLVNAVGRELKEVCGVFGVFA